jgi:hypothetical protein
MLTPFETRGYTDTQVNRTGNGLASPGNRSDVSEATSTSVVAISDRGALPIRGASFPAALAAEPRILQEGPQMFALPDSQWVTT